jgi:hypothetical protein
MAQGQCGDEDNASNDQDGACDKIAYNLGN